jgi:hypothetical protein
MRDEQEHIYYAWGLCYYVAFFALAISRRQSKKSIFLRATIIELLQKCADCRGPWVRLRKSKTRLCLSIATSFIINQ